MNKFLLNAKKQGWAIWTLFIIFAICSTAFLRTVPGLMGDEASEGQNVYELLISENITVQGERSYIGPFIDYVRVPFVALFGYSALTVRMPVLIASLAAFWLAYISLKRMLGEQLALYGMSTLFFSTCYLLQTRIGWAISLIPFFSFLLLYFFTQEKKYSLLFAGLAGGIGLSNHILFLPTLAAIAIVWFLSVLKKPNRLTMFWLFIIGFWAGFAMQFAVLHMFTEDQGAPDKVAELFSERLSELPLIYTVAVSGSSYIGRFTGTELSPFIISVTTFTVTLLAILAFIASQRKKAILGLWGGLIIHTLILLYMIDRFTLRYFVGMTIWVWLLAGIGIGAIALYVFPTQKKIHAIAPIIMATVLSIIYFTQGIIPFMQTGGSVSDFSLGNRTNSAADLVDERPLIACLRGAGPVFSENIHIYNRLQYLQHQYNDLYVLREEEKKEARLQAVYRSGKDATIHSDSEYCPDLEHFVVYKTRNK